MGKLIFGIDKLTRVGVSDAASPRAQFHTRAANLVGIAFALLSVPYIPLEYALGAPKLALATLVSCFVFPLSIPLNYFGFSRLARAVPIVTGTAMAWLVALAVSPDGQVQVVLFMIGLWAFAFYDARTEWVDLLALQLIPATAFFSLSAGWQPIEFEWKPSAELLSSYAIAMPATTFVLSSMFLFLFYRRNQINEDRLVQAVSQLEVAHQAARAGEQAKAEFLAVMSHEIRTPLGGVLGSAELIARQPLSREQRRLLKHLTTSAESLLELMSAILDYTQLDNGRARLIEASVDAAGLVDDAVESFADAAAGRELRLWFRPDPSVPATLRLDPGRLRLIVASLVSNAVKFTKVGHVAVDLCFKGKEDGSGNLELSVSDTGKGIPQESRATIFDSFHQLDHFARRLEGGVGLGLAVAQATAALMKGTLNVESISGVGSRFTLVIPTRASRITPVAPSELAPSVRVVVEDSEHALALREKLSRWGHRVLSDQSLELADVLLVDQRDWDQRTPAQRSECLKEALVVILTDPLLPAPEGVACVSWYLRRGPWLSALSSCGGWAQLPEPAPSSSIPASASLSKADTPALLEHSGMGMLRERSGRPAPQRPSDARERSSTPAPSRNRITSRILIAEDQPMIRDVLARMVGPHCDEVRVVGNGSAAVEAWECWAPAVILMDVQMPVMDGLEATRQIRAREGSVRRTPIIAITANALPEQRAEGLQAGMDVYLSKPIQIDQLVAVLEKVCRQAESFT